MSRKRQGASLKSQRSLKRSKSDKRGLVASPIFVALEIVPAPSFLLALPRGAFLQVVASNLDVEDLLMLAATSEEIANLLQNSIPVLHHFATILGQRLLYVCRFCDLNQIMFFISSFPFNLPRAESALTGFSSLMRDFWRASSALSLPMRLQAINGMHALKDKQFLGHPHTSYFIGFIANDAATPDFGHPLWCDALLPSSSQPLIVTWKRQEDEFDWHFTVGGVEARAIRS